MVKLGRIDICVEVYMISSQPVLTHQDYLEQYFHMFSYLRKYDNTEMVFDLSKPDINMSKFECRDWNATVYGDKLEE